jgi:hypothetical protein
MIGTSHGTSRLAKLIAGTGVVALLLISVATASGASTAVVRPGSLHGWIATSQTEAGRWVSGPGTAPMGAGSVQLRARVEGQLVYGFSAPPDLSTFVATYWTYGQTPPILIVLTDWNVGYGGQVLVSDGPPPVTGWQEFDAAAGSWQWDCDGDGEPDGSGSIADFGTSCDPNATVQMIWLIAFDGNTNVDAVEIGTSGSTTVYDMEPPWMSIRDASKSEPDLGRSLMTFRVVLSGPNDAPVQVHYATADGTAIAGRDYVATRGTLTIKPGTRGGTIKVPIIGDTRREGNETFKVKLRAPLNATLKVRSATGTIIDND